MGDKLQLYNSNHENNDKSLVFLSSGFLQPYNTITNNKLWNLLQQDYSVYAIDNIGHGQERKSKFTIANHKGQLLYMIDSTKKPMHIISNSFPGIFTTHALHNLLSDTDTKELIIKKIKSLTLLAPAVNSLGALDADFTKRNFILQALYKKGWGRSTILNFILNNLKGINADLDMLYNWAKDEIRFLDNFKKITEISHNIPIHIIFNTGDKAVLTQDKVDDQKILETLEINRFPNIGYTYTNADRHSIHLQDEFIKSNVLDNKFTIGNSIKEFINKNN